MLQTVANGLGKLKKECENLLENVNLTEGIECALPYGSGDERTEIVVDLINAIAEIG